MIRKSMQKQKYEWREKIFKFQDAVLAADNFFGSC